MRTIEINIYKIEDHPKQYKCFEWIRDNWYDLNDHSVYAIIDSLKELQKQIGGDLDWSISQVPDRGEYISFENYDDEALCRLSADDCPLTGACWDMDIIQGLRCSHIERVLDSLHSDTEYLYSDEGLTELCEANEYEFNEDGSIN